MVKPKQSGSGLALHGQTVTETSGASQLSTVFPVNLKPKMCRAARFRTRHLLVDGIWRCDQTSFNRGSFHVQFA